MGEILKVGVGEWGSELFFKWTLIKINVRFCDVIRKGVEVLVRREKVKKSEIKGYAISFSILSAFVGAFGGGCVVGV